MRSVAAVLLLAVALGTAGLASSSRLRETVINLPSTPDVSNELPIVDGPTRIAGYFKLDRTYDAHMFYFFFESRTNPSTDPVVLWMTGGPGCSSELAVFYENGPYNLINKTLTEAEFGWDVGHNMIFVDQPINTGFSYSPDERDRVYDEEIVSNDMLDFLQEFFEAHPEFADNDFYVTGESYAGHYVPAVSRRVWQAAKAGEGKAINLKGLAIGNGLTNPEIQYAAYADFALQNNLISQEWKDTIQWFYPACWLGCKICTATEFSVACLLGLEVCQTTMFAPIMAAVPGINVYDITKQCEGPLCYDFSAVSDYLARPDVRAALGVPDFVEWQSCDMDVHADMLGDWLLRYDTFLPEMMDDGVRVMIYAGTLDLICNWLGNERWLDALNWTMHEEWSAEAPKDWVLGSNEQAVGSVREVGPLSFVKVFKAGHMVPMDQPEVALSLITHFTRNEKFAKDQTAGGDDKKQSIFPSSNAKTAQASSSRKQL
jgi:carboxypeptidase C (cathepsin A)